MTSLFDLVGNGYVELVVELGIAPESIDTIVDFPAGQKFGVKAEGGASVVGATTLAELARRGGWARPSFEQPSAN